MTDTPKIADVCMVLEGTYPYVLGGVSAWVDQIIKGLPEVTFSLFFIGSKKELAVKQYYSLPPNVIEIREVYLHDQMSAEEIKPGKLSSGERASIYAALRKFYLADSASDRAHFFWEATRIMERAGTRFTLGNLLRDPEAWDILQSAYQRFCPDESFIDFFWTVRFLHLPLWTIWRGFAQMPQAKLYHTICAGYAGLAAAAAARKWNVPCLLTEHGIYTKERIAEISQADWIYESDTQRMSFSDGLGKLKQLWIGLFVWLGKIIYDTADQIATLYDGNVLIQLEFGMERSKSMVIPNGIDPSKFNAIRDQISARWQPEPQEKFVGFVGRVVPIKDVKTLLRAARMVCEKNPRIQFLIAGPYNEDPAYFDECKKIAKLLAIEDKIHFLGMQKLMEILPKMDIMVLTSISEGLPLVVLEAMAAGIPCVATDVGACRELVFGRAPEDKAIGRAGRLTKILSPQETASALLSILGNAETWRKMGSAGRKRAEDHYTMTQMLNSYRELYADWIRKGPLNREPQPTTSQWLA